MRASAVEIRDYLRVLRARWKSIIAVTVLGVAAAVLGTFLTTPLYAASSQLFVSTTGTADVSAAYQGNLFSQQRVTSYAELIKGEEVAQRVVDDLDLTESAAAVAGQVSVQVVPDTVLLTVTVTDPSAVRARDLVNAISRQFTGLVTELETPTGGTVAAAKVTVVQVADQPTSPVSPQPLRNLALGLVLGVLLGAGLAVLRDRLDNTVKERREVVENTGAPVVGAVPYDSERSSKPLISFSSGHSTSAEVYRQLRTNLQFLDVDHPPRVLVLTSAVPGEGKTTTACNLAFVLAEAGHQVLLVEADLRRPRVARYLNLVESVGITNVLAGTADLDDVLQPTGSPNVSVLASGPHPPNPSELLGSVHMQQLLGTVRTRYDYVVIDAPPLLPVTDAAVLTTLADGAILVVRHGRTRRGELARAAENLRAIDARVLGTVLNMVPAKAGAYEYAYYYETDPAPTPPPVTSAVTSTVTAKKSRRGRRHRAAAEDVRVDDARADDARVDDTDAFSFLSPPDEELEPERTSGRFGRRR